MGTNTGCCTAAVAAFVECKQRYHIVFKVAEQDGMTRKKDRQKKKEVDDR